MLVEVVESFFKSLIGSGMAETHMYIHIYSKFCMTVLGPKACSSLSLGYRLHS